MEHRTVKVFLCVSSDPIRLLIVNSHRRSCLIPFTLPNRNRWRFPGHNSYLDVNVFREVPSESLRCGRGWLHCQEADRLQNVVNNSSTFTEEEIEDVVKALADYKERQCDGIVPKKDALNLED